MKIEKVETKQETSKQASKQTRLGKAHGILICIGTISTVPRSTVLP